MEWSLSRVAGFVASLILAVQSGLSLSFNVYAVELKRIFSLNQTQVELVGSFTVGGISTGILAIIIINKFGYRACYVVTWVMVTSPCILMWLIVVYVEIFRGNVALLCFLQLTGSSGMSNILKCLVAVGILQFPKRHTGKVIGFYTSLVYIGIMCYSVLFNSFFQFDGGLGWFFLFISVSVTIPFIVCFLLYMPPETDRESQLLLHNPPQEQTEEMVKKQTNQTGNNEERPKNQTVTVTQILRSSFFHVVMWPNVLFQSCGLSFMNNVTSIAASLEIVHPEITIYIMTVAIIVFRIGFAVVFDRYGTKFAGLILFQICSFSFSAAMFVGLFWLNHISIYFITFLAAIGAGALYSLTLGVLTLSYGRQHFILISSIHGFGLTCSVSIVEIFMGMTYDHANQILNPKSFLCAECFHWTFLILLCTTLFHFIFQSVHILITIRQQ